MVRKAGDLILASWPRTVAAAVLLVVLTVVVVLGVLALQGPLKDVSFPGHPYPPAGSFRNPFSNDPNDLVATTEARVVKADLARAGQAELDAFEHGDPVRLADGDAGNRLAAAQRTVAENNAQGVAERWVNKLTQVTCGRLKDPNDASVDWVCEEDGASTVTYFRKADGGVVRTTPFTFMDKFWMVRPGRGQHYLITDAELSTSLGPGG